MSKKPEVVVPISRFRRSMDAELVPEIDAAPLPQGGEQVTPAVASKPAINLSDRPKIWCLLSSNGGGKTTYARRLKWRTEEQGKEPPRLAALDPGGPQPGAVV